MINSFSQGLKEALAAERLQSNCCIAAHEAAVEAITATKAGTAEADLDGMRLKSAGVDLKGLRQADAHAKQEQRRGLADFRRDCCKRSILRAAFLACGTMSDPKAGYHLEFTVAGQTVCDDLVAIMFEMDLQPKVAIRRRSFVIYFKNSDQIADTITAMGAYNIMVEFWDIKLEKEKRNNANRLVNCDSHNMDKSISAAFSQVRAINRIAETVGLESLPEKLAVVCRMRLNSKEATLAEIGQALNPPVSKSAVNNRMRRIMQIAKDLDDDKA